MRYQNTSNFVKTFHGVTFQPGEIRDVCGNINDPAMIIVFGIPEAVKQQDAEVADSVDSVSTEIVKVQDSTDIDTSPKSVRRNKNKEG